MRTMNTSQDRIDSIVGAKVIDDRVEIKIEWATGSASSKLTSNDAEKFGAELIRLAQALTPDQS